MAYSESTTMISLPASADLSASQYCFVSINTSGQVELSGAAGNAAGILQNKPEAAGRAAEVLIAGVSKLVCAGAGSGTRAGYNLASAASGQGAEATTGDFRLGLIIETATNANEIATVLFSPNGKVA